MLFKFKSKACADLIMLEADGRRILRAMTGDAPAKGIVQWADMAPALARLEAAVHARLAPRRNSNGSGREWFLVELDEAVELRKLLVLIGRKLARAVLRRRPLIGQRPRRRDLLAPDQSWYANAEVCCSYWCYP